MTSPFFLWLLCGQKTAPTHFQPSVDAGQQPFYPASTPYPSASQPQPQLFVPPPSQQAPQVISATVWQDVLESQRSHWCWCFCDYFLGCGGLIVFSFFFYFMLSVCWPFLGEGDVSLLWKWTCFSYLPDILRKPGLTRTSHACHCIVFHDNKTKQVGRHHLMLAEGDCSETLSFWDTKCFDAEWDAYFVTYLVET